MSGRIALPRCGVALLLLLLLGGCSSTVKRLSAKEYFTRADKAFVEENFILAIESYRDLLDQYPLNPYAEEAQLKIAYSYYLNKQYTEAAAAFNDFERAYPTSTHLPFVEYYRGMCYLEQMRSIDRDQSVTEKAYGYFQKIVDRYPKSAFRELAEEKIGICREAMAAKELYVANFSEQQNNSFGAMVRLRTIIEKYPETEATVSALARLEEILIQAEETELAELAAKALALRKAAPPAEDQTQVASLLHDDLPAPSVDPLLLLVTGLKAREETARKEAADAFRDQLLEYQIEQERQRTLKEAIERAREESESGEHVLEGASEEEE